jgi:hypothetical protein
MIGKTATVLVDGEEITGTVYNVRDNGWYCVGTEAGRVASGPEVLHITSPFTGERTSHVRIEPSIELPGS